MDRIVHVAGRCLLIAGIALFASCGSGGGSAGNDAGGSSSSSPSSLAPAITSLAPSSLVAGSAAFSLQVDGSNFTPASTVQWNGSARATTYVSASELTAAITAADIASPVQAEVTVVTPAPGGGTSAPVAITALWPKPASSSFGRLIDAPTQLSSVAELDALGGPVFSGWNPAAASVEGPGLKLMMFGQPNSACPSNTQGPTGGFADEVLQRVGYPGSASAVASALRYQPVPMSSCTSAASALSGPNVVFFDGSQLWFGTSTLGDSTKLLNPYPASGVNGSGANAHIISSAADFRFSDTVSPILPWAQNGRARLAAMAQVTDIQVQNAASLTQSKQLMGFAFINTVCAATLPNNLCQIFLQFTQGIAQSNVSNWAAETSFQHPNLFLDPAKNDMPTLGVVLIPAAGQVITDATYGLPLMTSRGAVTQHGTFALTQFDIEVDFSQFENVILLFSSLATGQALQTGTACPQCVTEFGASWNQPGAWVMLELKTSQEVYDESGDSGAIFGGYSWLYGGAAP
jgi:hypothetical protein